MALRPRRKLQSIQLPWLPLRIAARKPPPAAIPRASQIHQSPADGRRHRWPVGPEPALGRGIQVHQEEGHHVGGTRLGHRLLAPCLEHGRGGGGLGCALDGSPGMAGHGGDGGDLMVEVVLEGGFEGVHDAKEFVAGEDGGGWESGEVRVELFQASQERFCSPCQTSS
jgi:hypothetical protein